MMDTLGDAGIRPSDHHGLSFALEGRISTGDGSVPNQVVAHFRDGRILKGVSLDVDANRPHCHISTRDEGTLEVKLTDLKALFFVKSLTGNPAHNEASTVDPEDERTRGAYSIELEFADGEKVSGLTVRYPPIKPFFFVLPVDTASNNIRILVNRDAVVKMRQPWES